MIDAGFVERTAAQLTDLAAAKCEEEWEMVAVYTWINPDGSRLKIPARFYLRQRPSTERAIDRVVMLQEGYPSAPDEVEVWPARRVG